MESFSTSSETPAAETTATTTTATTSATVTEESATVAQLMVVKDYQIVGIVLPIALLTVIINATVVGVGVFICVFRSKKSKKRGEDKTVHGYENLEVSSASLEQRQHSRQEEAADSET